MLDAVLLKKVRANYTNAKIFGFDVGHIAKYLIGYKISPEAQLDAQSFGDIH